VRSNKNVVVPVALASRYDVTITKKHTLVDVAFIVCTALAKAGATAVLTGGSAATFYAPRSYQSRDADFVIVFAADSAQAERALFELGYTERGGSYHHDRSPFTLDFPQGPLGVGADLITTFETKRRDGLFLNVLSRTDSVRDRLAAFYHWDDRSSLRVALNVAATGPVDFAAIREWTEREGMSAKGSEFEALYARIAAGGK